jgi:hypothetical protein
MTKVQPNFYMSRYSQPYRANSWSDESQAQYVSRRPRSAWAKLDLRHVSDGGGPKGPRKWVRTRLRKVLRSSLEVGAFGTIFATFLSSLYMLG